MPIKAFWIFFVLALLIISCNDDNKVIPAPTIYLSIPEGGYDIDKDSSFIIEPRITYDLSSSYDWQLDGRSLQSEKNLTFENYDLGEYNFFFSVTTPSGSDTMTIRVNALDIFTFEEYTDLNEDGYNNNPANGAFTFDEIALSNAYTSDEDWSGFAISNNTNKSLSGMENQFSVYATSGSGSSELFMVYRPSEETPHRILFNDSQRHVVSSIDVNNSTYAYLNMANKAFDKKNNTDFFCLTITGYDEMDNPLDSIDFYLADYRFDRLSDRYIVGTWRTIDLTSLGEISSLGFTLSSSVDGDPTIFLPQYFCLDNLKLKS